jgi:hypothetical protein
MIRRIGAGNLGVLDPEQAPEASRDLERDGCAVLRAVFSPDEIDGLRTEIDAVYDAVGPERTRSDASEMRYEMLNRSAACQQAVAHPTILAAIEPLLGGDCHVIANTAWRNPGTFGGGPWHCDAGPHIPRPEGVPWDDRIPYPVFAIGAHLYLQDCDEVDGPTAVVPGSHRSGRLPPRDRVDDPDLSYDGRPPVVLAAAAGDVALFASDTWHRGTPAGPDGRGRYFLQVHYGRRDIAQRIRTTGESHQLSDEAIERARTDRDRRLIGLHEPYFYDG